MKLDLNKQFKGLDGNDLEGDMGHMGRLLANQLAGGSKGELLKIMPWAQKLYDKKPIEIDLADKILIEGLVKESSVITNLAKYQIGQELSILKD